MKNQKTAQERHAALCAKLAAFADMLDSEEALEAELRFLLLSNGFDRETAFKAAAFYVKVRDNSPEDVR